MISVIVNDDFNQTINLYFFFLVLLNGTYLFMIIETERLLLRPFTVEDADAVLEFSSDPIVLEQTGDKLTNSKAEVLDIINNIWLKEYANIGYGRYAVIHKGDNKLIGFSGLKFDTVLNATDIGYRILPSYWGKGIATESSLPFIKIGFEKFSLEEIVGVAYETNPASIRVLEKLGMQLQKTGDFFDSGHICKWYAISKAEYLNASKTE
jgi:RimJ/RimL family protein N-acetyltransferase